MKQKHNKPVNRYTDKKTYLKDNEKITSNRKKIALGNNKGCK